MKKKADLSPEELSVLDENDESIIVAYRKAFDELNSNGDSFPIGLYEPVEIIRFANHAIKDELHGPLLFDEVGDLSDEAKEKIQEVLKEASEAYPNPCSVLCVRGTPRHKDDLFVLEFSLVKEGGYPITFVKECDHPSLYVAGYNKQGCYKCGKEWDI